MPNELPPDEFELDGFPYPASKPPSRTSLEVLLEDFTRRLRDGEQPNVEVYAFDHPEFAAEIRELFPLAAEMERCKQRRTAQDFQEAVKRRFNFRRVGHVRIIRELGRGGMGVVFEGEHEAHRRHVALKLLPLRFADRSEIGRRFEREALTASRLSHPNIVSVLEFGRWNDFFFYVMPFVNGVGLDRIIHELAGESGVVFAEAIAQRTGSSPQLPMEEPEEHGTNDNSQAFVSLGTGPASISELPAADGRGIERLQDHRHTARRLERNSWKQFARIGRQAADALHYAHEKQIVHRDVKPANVLLDRSGRVHVTDFGLAAPLTGIEAREAAELAGTLQYMSPERFRGQCDHRADIYGLGTILYELVTGRPPFPEHDPQALIKAITTTTPVLPRSIDRMIPVDLEAIISKAIAQDPADRYRTAGLLMDDLQCFLSGKAIAAKKPPERKRFGGRKSGRRSN